MMSFKFQVEKKELAKGLYKLVMHKMQNMVSLLPLWAFLINLHVLQTPKGKEETSFPYTYMKHSKKFPGSFEYHLT
jgi:hypothetical protein